MRIAQIILDCARAQVCGKQRADIGEISSEDMSVLYSLSKAHDMAHVVAAELESQGILKDDEISEKFRKQQLLAVLRYERINYELLAVCELLETERIEHMPLKGAVIRRLYPEPWMRTSADIDLLVHKDDVERVALLFEQKLGYRREKSGTDHDVPLFAPSGVHVELHYETITEDDGVVSSTDVLRDVWLFTVPRDGCEYGRELMDSMFYFYHIAHMAKHFEGKGCGLRFFLDTWLLCNKKEYDADARNALLSEGGLLTFAENAQRLAEAWFGNGEKDSVTRSMERYVLGGGIYGSMTNKMATAQLRDGGKLGYAKARIFLPYKEMKLRFPTLLKHKWLLPFFHVYRWIRIIFGGGIKRSVNELKRSSAIETDEREEIGQMLEALGLIK